MSQLPSRLRSTWPVVPGLGKTGLRLFWLSLRGRRGDSLENGVKSSSLVEANHIRYSIHAKLLIMRTCNLPIAPRNVIYARNSTVELRSHQLQGRLREPFAINVLFERSRIWAKPSSVNCIAPFKVSFEIIHLSQFSFHQNPNDILYTSDTVF